MKNRIESFRYAIQGLKMAFLEEPNFRIHIYVLSIVIFVSFFVGLSRLDWIAIALVASLVIITELLNTAIENLCDHVTPERHPAIGRIKDISAGAVLISAIMAIFVGLVVFTPYILAFWAV